jgi:hypothetical protein
MRNKVDPIIRKIKKRFEDIGYDPEYAEALAYKTYCSQNPRAKGTLCEEIPQLPTSRVKPLPKYASAPSFALAYLLPSHAMILIAQLTPQEQNMLRVMRPNISEVETLFNITDKFIIKGRISPLHVEEYIRRAGIQVAYTYLM